MSYTRSRVMINNSKLNCPCYVTHKETGIIEMSILTMRAFFFFFHRKCWIFILGTVSISITDNLHTVSLLKKTIQRAKDHYLYSFMVKHFNLTKIHTDIQTRFNNLFCDRLFIHNCFFFFSNVKYTHHQAILYSQTCNFSSSLASLFHRLIGCPEMKRVSFGALLCKPNRIKEKEQDEM